MRYSCILMFLLSVMTSGTVKSQSLDCPVPLDSEVRYGKLDNGLTYYIRQVSFYYFLCAIQYLHKKRSGRFLTIRTFFCVYRIFTHSAFYPLTMLTPHTAVC